jgi:alpha-L-fucosidase
VQEVFATGEVVRKLQPDIFINDRGFGLGDFSTPEREYRQEDSLTPYSRMTEACNAIGAQSWGYRREEDFYSYRHLLRSICKTMARGGSYLLNIGPKPDGSLDPTHAARIARIGKWYTAMEGALQCHEPDEYDYAVHKSGSCIVTKKNGKSYFWFYDGTTSTAVAIANYPGLPKSVRLLNTGEALPFAAERLPEFFKTNGVAEHIYLHIRNIPVDDLAQEPIALEIEW